MLPGASLRGQDQIGANMSGKAARRARKGAQEEQQPIPVLRTRPEQRAVLVEKYGDLAVQRLERLRAGADEVVRIEHEMRELVEKLRKQKMSWQHIAIAVNMSEAGARRKYRGSP